VNSITREESFKRMLSPPLDGLLATPGTSELICFSNDVFPFIASIVAQQLSFRL
jgi:hypothetical protein